MKEQNGTPTVAAAAPEPKASSPVAQPSMQVTQAAVGLFGDNGLIAVTLSLLAGVLFLRRKFFQDGNDIAKGKAEVTLIDTLIEQAETYKEDARKAWAQRTRDAEMIARQQVHIEHLTRVVNAMQRTLEEVCPDKAKAFEHTKPFEEHEHAKSTTEDEGA